MLYFETEGRLGNLMFEYAAALSLSDQVVAYARDENTIRILRNNDIFNGLEVVDQIPVGIVKYCEQRFSYSPIVGYDQTKDFAISGFFQSEKYFDKTKVMRTFELSSVRRDRILSKFNAVLSEDNVTGIHVRRGDYLDIPERYPFVGEKYLKDCVCALQECNTFVVCSDDIAWCKNFFSHNFPSKEFIYSDSNNALDDLYLLSLCRNCIMSNSSFSWWGAWLNKNPNKKVFAPSHWFGFAHPNAKDSLSDLYFNGVEIIKNGYTFKQYVSAVGKWSLHWLDWHIHYVYAVLRRKCHAQL